MGRRVVSAVCIALVTALLQAAPQQAAAEDRDYLVLGVGWFDVIFHDNVATSARLEYRSGYDLLWTIKPFVGVMGTTDEAYYGYGGFYIDFALAELFPETPVVNRIVVNGNAAVGYYEEGDGKDLGNSLEFRTGAEIAYQFENRMRLGVAFYHISNAGSGSVNPGTEILSAFFALPLGGW